MKSFIMQVTLGLILYIRKNVVQPIDDTDWLNYILRANCINYLNFYTDV